MYNIFFFTRLLNVNPGCPEGCGYTKEGRPATEIWCFLEDGPYTPIYTCPSTTFLPTTADAQTTTASTTTTSQTSTTSPTTTGVNLKGTVEQSIVDAEAALTEINSILSVPSLSDDQKSSLESIKTALENLKASLSQYWGTLTRRRVKRELDQLGHRLYDV